MSVDSKRWENDKTLTSSQKRFYKMVDILLINPAIERLEKEIESQIDFDLELKNKVVK